MEQRNIDFFKEIVEELLEAQDHEALREYLSELNPYEIAKLLEEYEEPEQLVILSLTTPEVAAEALEHLDYDDQYRLLDHSDENVAREILSAMGRDAIADLVMAIHPNKAQKILQMVPHEYLDSINFVTYRGFGRRHNVFGLYQVRQYWTIERVIDYFRSGRKQSIANYIYVVDSVGKPVECCRLKNCF